MVLGHGLDRTVCMDTSLFFLVLHYRYRLQSRFDTVTLRIHNHLQALRQFAAETFYVFVHSLAAGVANVDYGPEPV